MHVPARTRSDPPTPFLLDPPFSQRASLRSSKAIAPTRAALVAKPVVRRRSDPLSARVARPRRGSETLRIEKTLKKRSFAFGSSSRLVD